jgi:hypothetical protein
MLIILRQRLDQFTFKTFLHRTTLNILCPEDGSIITDALKGTYLKGISSSKSSKATPAGPVTLGFADILAALAAEIAHKVLGVQVAVALGRKADVVALAVDGPVAAVDILAALAAPAYLLIHH